ncbi:hypothetical protein KQX54_018133, partial [Cotesia glomerata]
ISIVILATAIRADDKQKIIIIEKNEDKFKERYVQIVLVRLGWDNEWEKGRAADDTSAAAPKLALCRGELQ